MMYIKRLLLILFIIPFIGFGQQTYVPDDNFEQELINLGYDNILDDYVQTANIDNVISLNLQGKNISDLTGLEDFADLIEINCNGNQLASIDLSNNTDIMIIKCKNNLPLLTIDLRVPNYTTINTLIFTLNPNLSCIAVNNVSWFVSNFGNSNLFAPSCAGCTDSTASNYNPQAIIDDGSCQYPQVNWINPSSGDQDQTLSVTISGSNMNYGSQWSGTLSNFRFSQWSGSNMFYGNPTSTSGNNLYGNVSVPNGQNTGWYDLEVYDQNTDQWIQKSSAFEVLLIGSTIYGCTDPNATNYNPSATNDDGSCIFPPPISSITPNNAYQGQTLSVTISGNNLNNSTWSNTIVFSQWSGSSNNIFYGSVVGSTGNNHYGTVAIDGNQTPGWYDVEVYDQNTYQWVVLNNAFQVLYNPYGCTDPTAPNYNASATIDDGSCCYGANFNETFTFTNCGQTGRYGPSQSQINNEYSGTSLAGDVTSNNGIQEWVIPQTGTYTIEVKGADGGRTTSSNYQGGEGAYMSGEFQLTAGETIQILVGQKGQTVIRASGGGGGSFVVNSANQPLIIAGGGGGIRYNYNNYYEYGTTSTNGNRSQANYNGGSNGYGGGSYSSGGSGGGGFYSNGLDGYSSCSPGLAFTNGGTGGDNYHSYGGEGGFGGGGGADGYNYYAGGGGGGYSGGGAYHTSAGGGGSYNNGTNQSNTNGSNDGSENHGYVIISANINQITYGCTDTSAFNYDPSACVDDGSCIAKIFGCIHSTALNYQSFANTNDGSCIYDINISPDSTPQGVSLQVFVSGSDTTQFKVGSEPAVLSLIHNSDSSVLNIPNNYNNWQWSTADSSYGFYTNIDVDSSQFLSVNISGNQNITTWSYGYHYMNFSVPNSSSYNYDEPITFQFDFTGYSPYYNGGTYRIYDENGYTLLYLNNPNTNCGTTTNTYTASPYQLQQWASDGTITFNLYTDGSLSTTHSCDNLNCYFNYTKTELGLTNPGLYSLHKKADGNNGTLCDIVSQGSSITLTAPQGATISSIDYASYGNPQGSCGNFSDGWCDAFNSMSVVQSYCLGQNSCTVPATNTVFGDPCTGVNKQLAVQASYSFGSNDPQSTLMRPDAFTIYEGTPVLQQISPDTAHIGNNISVTISGFSMDYINQWGGLTNFKITNSTGTYHGISTYTIGDSLIGTLNIPLTAQVGLYDLEVHDQTTNHWIVLSDAFEVLPIFLNPNRITPNHAFPGDSLGVFISGSQSEFTNWSQGGGAPIRLLQADGNTIPIVNLAFTNWQYNNTVGSYGFNTFIDIPQSATLGIYTLQVDHTALNNWSTLESNAFGVFNTPIMGCSDSLAYNYDSTVTYGDIQSCIYPEILYISPYLTHQGVPVNISIYVENMDIADSSGNLSDFRLTHNITQDTIDGVSLSADSTGLMLYGYLPISTNTPIGTYSVEVFDQLTNQWIILGDVFYIEESFISPNQGYRGDSMNVTVNGFCASNATPANAVSDQFGYWSQSGTNYLNLYTGIQTDSNTLHFDFIAGQMDTYDYWYVYDEYGSLLTIYNPATNPGCNIRSFSYTASESQMQQWSADGVINLEIYHTYFTSYSSCYANDYFRATINLPQIASSFIDYSLVSSDSSTIIPLTITNDISCYNGNGVFEASIDIPDSAALGVYHFAIYDSIYNYNWFLSQSSFLVKSNQFGCTDPLADNYNATSVIDDGSCITCNISNTFLINSPTNSVSCDGVALSSAQSNYPITSYNWINYNDSSQFVSNSYFALDLCNGMYLFTVTDSAGCTITDTLFIGSFVPIFGCTDSTASNYDSTATIDDGSCCYLSLSLVVVNNNPPNSCNGWTFATTTGLNPPFNYTWSDSSTNYYIDSLCSGSYSLTVTDAVGCTVTENFIIGQVIIYGCTDSTANNYDPLANSDDGSCTYDIYGCTNANASNYNSLATIDDGSCIYSTNCGVITGVNLTDVIHDRATFNWDNMNSSACQVDQIRIRYRELGTSSYTNKTMGAPVGSGCNTSNTSKLVLGLTPSTTYEYDFKIWYCNASTISWHANGSFTTLPLCDNVINIIPTPITTTKTEFCWDTVSTYAFVRLKYREDVPGSSFSNIGGMGVHSPTLCKDKNGLTPGLTYRVMWRTWCNPSGGPYRSPQWDGPVLWTQPTSIRVDELSSISSLEVYPNPSRDVFNVSFISESKQSIKVRLVNLVGEIIFTENLENFEGEYSHSFNLSEYSKGVYLLELDADNGIVNKKLILQ